MSFKFILMLIVFLIGGGNLLFSDEILFDFNNVNNMEYDAGKAEVYNGKLRLAPTGFWTNTGNLSGGALPIILFQDLQKNLFYSAYPMGPMGNIYKSSNYGASWVSVYANRGHSIIQASDGNLYSAMGNAGSSGVIKSYDQGGSWAQVLNQNYQATTIAEVVTNDFYTSIWIYNVAPNWSTNLLYKSVDYGTNWNLIFKEGVTNVAVIRCFYWIKRINSNVLLAGKGGGSSGMPTGIYLSSNKGTNWTLMSGTSNQNYQAAIFRGSDNYLYTGGESGILKSSDGLLWTRQSSEQCQGLIESSDGMFYKTVYSNVWKSFDKGASWSLTPDARKDNKNYGQYLSKALLQADNGKIFFGGAVSGNDGYVFRSGYSDFSEIILDFLPQAVNKWLSFSRSDLLNGGGLTYEFSSSTNSGDAWSAWTALNDANLLSVPCLGNGKDRLKVRINMTSPDHETTPEVDWICLRYDSGLRQNFDDVVVAPNPFRPDTDRDRVVFYNLPSEFDLKVYSKTGREINHIKGRSSAGRFVWDGKDGNGKEIKSGVYFCRLSGPSGDEKTLKLVVIK